MIKYLTGYCADEDFIESLINDVKNGYTLREAFENLGRVADKLIEQEYDREVFEDSLIANNQYIDEFGKIHHVEEA